MRKTRTVLVVGVAGLLGCLLVSPASAQDPGTGGLALTGSLFAGIKRFSGDPATNVLDGEALGGAAAVGTRLADRWLIQLEVEAASFSTHLQPHDVRLGTGKNATTITVQRRTLNRPFLVSALAGYRSAPHGRLRFQYLAGLTFLHLDRQTDTVAPAGTPAALIAPSSEVRTNGPAATVGVDAELTLTAHLSLVPAVRATAFNASDAPSGFLIRPAVGLRWTFE